MLFGLPYYAVSKLTLSSINIFHTPRQPFSVFYREEDTKEGKEMGIICEKREACNYSVTVHFKGRLIYEVNLNRMGFSTPKIDPISKSDLAIN